MSKISWGRSGMDAQTGIVDEFCIGEKELMSER